MMQNPNGHDQFIRIQHAYEILSDPDKRAHWDAGGYQVGSKPRGCVAGRKGKPQPVRNGRWMACVCVARSK